MKVATFFPENVNDFNNTPQPPPIYAQMQGYYNNTIVDKSWVNWTGGHGSIFMPNNNALDSSGDNASVAVINWFNAYHPPTTPFTPVGSQIDFANTAYSYSTGTVDPSGQNVSYQFNWGDGASNTTGYYPSGTNVTCSHAWFNPGSYNVTVQARDSQNVSCWSPPLTVNVYGANITCCDVYYNNAAQNLTTVHMEAPQDYFANVNFTWNAARTDNVVLLVGVLNPDGSTWAWYPLNGPKQYNFLDPGNHTENIEIKNYTPSPGTGTLTVTLTSNGSNLATPWNEAVNIVNSNHPPNPPSISYTPPIPVGMQCGFTVNATDPDGDNVQYVLNWGDGSGNTTLAWRPSGVAETGYHAWTNTGTYNVTAYVYDPYGASNSETFQVQVTNKTGGGCPYVYDWNGSTYVKDNNLLPASENGNGTDTKDYYLLQQPLVPVLSGKQKSVYSLQIGEFESNIDYIDQVKLLAIDHSQGTNIAVTQDGSIITYGNPAAPLSCVDNYGNSELTQISSMNGNVSDPSTYFLGNRSDWLLLDFGRVTGPYANLILRDDMKCSECIYVQVPNQSGWQNVTVLNPRDYWSVEAVNMSAYLLSNGDFIVRLYWTQTHRLDYVGLDTSPPAQVQVYSAPPTLAIHSTQGDVTSKLIYDDENCVELTNGQYITIAFTLPNQQKGTTRDFILYTDGYYYTIS